MNSSDVISQYLEEVKRLFYSGHAIEHAYRPALQRLMESFDDVTAVNDPKHSEHGAPDYVFLKKSNVSIIRGYAEAKDITVSLDKTEKTNQMERYAGYTNLFLTDYLEFRFYENGEKYETISLGEVKNGMLYLHPENGDRLMRELQAFLDLPPESIRSGRRLAEIMGGKARRIRDNVEVYLTDDAIDAHELEKIYEMMKKLLVHDMDETKFADMYAQTLVYGLFVARYGDDSPESFTRAEARDLVPASNPFLRNFFDHIAGTGFDKRLAKIVDELCEIFSVSDVREIVHKHLKVADDNERDAKDPIIHFYEDFLQSYDPAERKKMGAYYTPIPVVRFIVRHIDQILKDEFGIAKGLASTETITRTIDTQPWRKKGERKDRTTREIQEPRVQILDPAVGTATFLNETIKYIYEQNFKGKQEGRWASYANENLIPRLFGFELMMAPYTVAHLKLGMTLRETGVEKLTNRLNVFLTNTLEEGVPQQSDLFSFGLAEAVSEESRLAAEVKSDKPVMVVMGNPPYSGESSNKIASLEKHINKKYLYRDGVRLSEKGKKNWLQDDYVKFISFAEDMITRNGSGVVGMITNNGYLDNPTFRNMRYHLRKSFDAIYVIDLHGNTKKGEKTSDGKVDINVFDINQGVSIILAIKHYNNSYEMARMYFSEIQANSRQEKFDYLHSNISFQELSPADDTQYFKPIGQGDSEYNQYIKTDRLFRVWGNGVITSRDKFVLDDREDDLAHRIKEFLSREVTDEDIIKKYNLKNNSMWSISKSRSEMRAYGFKDLLIRPIMYRPFDTKLIYYDKNIVMNLRYPVMKHYDYADNSGMLLSRMTKNADFAHIFATDTISEAIFLSPYSGTNAFNFPLYTYGEDGTRTPNFNTAELSALTRNLTTEPTPEEVLDYIYGVLHSPSYREKYREFLKIDFPRVPAPASDAEFARFVKFGNELRDLHLMKSSVIDDYDTTYPVAGDDTVEKITREGTNVYINDTQYFGNVPDTAWNFYIGGYQPAQKWLKDRKGRTLTSDDLDHYQRIIKILLETDRIMKEIG